MGTTATHALPYPEPTDAVTQGDQAIEDLALAVAATLCPSGTVVPFAGSAAPAGGHWLLANGQLVSRTTYARLFTAIGTTYGAGDGSTTFALPDLRGRTVVGVGTGAGLTARTLGQLAGGQDAVLPSHSHGGGTGGQSADHSHSGSTGGQSADHSHATHLADVAKSGSGTFAKGYSAGAGDNTFGASNDHSHAFGTGGVSAGHTHGITAEGVAATDGRMPPFVGLNYLVKS